MDARRTRILAGAALLGSLLATMWAGPAAAADCTLSAPAYVNVGDPLAIAGSGFPVSSDVDITFSVEGSETDAFTVQSDANGELQIALTPEDIDTGETTVTATAGTACTARVVYTVLAAGATPPPQPTEEPADDSGTGSEPTAPRTDTASAVRDGHGWSFPAAWALAATILALGAAGLFLTRSTRRR